MPTEAVIRLSYDGFLAPLRKEALRECLHVWENCIAGISGMHRSTVCRTRVHEPGKKAELEGCIFPGFVLSSVHSLWHLGEGVCCRRSYPEPLRIFLGAAVPGGEDVFPARKNCGLTDSNTKALVRESVIMCGTNSCVDADMCSERKTSWPPSMRMEENICFCSKCVFMTSIMMNHPALSLLRPGDFGRSSRHFSRLNDRESLNGLFPST